MCTKYFADGDVHKYFNHYDSPYDAYINFMNVLDNLDYRCSRAILRGKRDEYEAAAEQTVQMQNDDYTDKLHLSERSML
jgi:alpha-amylase